MTKLFANQPIGTKHYSEMQVKEIRDELAAMLKELRTNLMKDGCYWPTDLMRQSKVQAVQSGCTYPGTVKVSYDIENSSMIDIALVKQLQQEFNLKDTDSLVFDYSEDYDGFGSVTLSFAREEKETDLEYYSKIKELYLENSKSNKVHKFILDIKKRTGVDTPYYQAKKMLEIFEEYKKGNLL